MNWLRTECSSCGSAYWSTLTVCEICEQRVCDQCPGAEYVDISSVVCGKCMADVLEVFDRIRPAYFETVCDLIEATPGADIPLELFHEIVDCKSVAEVGRVFRKHYPAPVIEMPKRRKKAA